MHCVLLILLGLVVATGVLHAGEKVVLEAGVGGSLSTHTPVPEKGEMESGAALDSFSGKPLFASRKRPATPTDGKAFALAKEAMNLLHRRKYAEAASKLTQAEALDSNNPLVLDVWISLLSETKDFERAHEYADRRVLQSPRDFVARYNRAAVYVLEHNYEKAREEYLKVLKEFPESQIIWLQLLLMALKQNKPEEAASWLERFELVPPSECSYYAQAAVAFANGDLATAKRWIQDCFRDFGTGMRVYLLYKQFSEQGWVLLSDYPVLPMQ